MNTCDSCRYWDKKSKSETKGYHHCTHPLNAGFEEDTNGFTGGDCGEPFNCGCFASGPKFGCVHWTGRSNTGVCNP